MQAGVPLDEAQAWAETDEPDYLELQLRAAAAGGLNAAMTTLRDLAESRQTPPEVRVRAASDLAKLAVVIAKTTKKAAAADGGGAAADIFDAAGNPWQLKK